MGDVFELQPFYLSSICFSDEKTEDEPVENDDVDKEPQM